MKAAKRIINSFDFEEVCLLVTFMRSDSKERILKQLEEMQSDDKTIYQLRDSIKEKILKTFKMRLIRLRRIQRKQYLKIKWMYLSR